MRRTCLLVIAAGTVFGLTAAAARERVPALGRLRFEGRASPTIHVRYQDHRLRVAPSFEKLRTARPLPLKWTKTWCYDDEQVYFRQRRYAEVRLTGRIGRFSEVRMRPVVSVGFVEAPKRGEREPESWHERLEPEFHFLYRDGSGGLWDYVTWDECPLLRTVVPAKARLTEVPVPDPARLRLILEPAPRKGSAGVLIRARAGRSEIDDVRRNGRSVPLRVGVKTTKGEVVHSAVGGLPRFASRPTDCYCIEIPKGTYIVTATLDRTPFSESATVSRPVEVK